MDWYNIKILDIEKGYLKRWTELILIKGQQNPLNLQEDTALLSDFYFPINKQTQKQLSTSSWNTST